MRAEALHSFVPYGADKANQLSLFVGDIVQVVKKDKSGWWAGHKEGGSQNGWFPAGIVRALEVSNAHNSVKQPLATAVDTTSPASATVHSVWSGVCAEDGKKVCQPPEAHGGPALAPALLATNDAMTISHASPANALSEGVKAANIPKMVNLRESIRAPHQVCTSLDALRCASPLRVRSMRRQHSPHCSSGDAITRRATSPLATREGPTRMATPSHRGDAQRVASPLILSREPGRCASPKHLRRERHGITTTAAVKDNAHKRVSPQPVRSNQRHCSPSNLQTHLSPSVSRRPARGVPVSSCQNGRQTISREDLCRADPSDRKSVPSQSMARDAFRKSHSKPLQCQAYPEIHDFAGHGVEERSQCFEEELQCSKREWNKVAERQFQLEEELRALRKEQELQLLQEQVGQQLGRLQEDVEAKEKRLSKLEAMLDGCEFAALAAARASDHTGVPVRDLINAIERRSSIGTPPSTQKHQMHSQLDQQQLMPKHQ